MKSRDYCDFVQNIGVKDCLGIQMFKESTWGANYNVDTSLLHRNGRRTNNNHVYQMFGELSGMEAEEVRIAMLNEITTSYEWYERRCMAVLHTLDMSLSRWLGKHMKKNVRADCIALFALSVMYDRHTVVYNSKMPWCTKKWFGREDEGNLFTACHIHLLYVGDNMFVILRPITQQDTANHVSLSSMIPGCTVDVFSSNTETHVEYQFDAPNMTSINEHDNNDCSVVDYYPGGTGTVHNKTIEYENIPSDEDCVPFFPAFDEDVADTDDSSIERLSDGFHIHQQKLELERLKEDQEYASVIKNVIHDTSPEHSTASSGFNNTSEKTDILDAKVGVNPTAKSNTPASSGSKNTSEKTAPEDYQAITNLVSDMLDQIELAVKQELIVVGEIALIKLENDTNCVFNSNFDVTSSNIATTCTEDVSSFDETCSTSSISHTETDLSDNENLIRSCSGHVVANNPKMLSLKIVLPKLSDKTINYWRNRDTANTPHSDLKQTTVEPSTLTGKPIFTQSETTPNSDEPTKTPETQIIPTNEHNIPVTPSNTVQKTISGSETASMSGSISSSGNDSVSESLLKPTNSRPSRTCTKRKYKNYKNMCKSESSSSTDDTTPSKQTKPTPGALPSLSRMRAQELISRHRIKTEGLVPKVTQNDKNTAGYSGDTEYYSDEDAISSNSSSRQEDKPLVSPTNKVKINTIASSGVHNTSQKPKLKTKKVVKPRKSTSNGQLNIEHKGLKLRKPTRNHGCPKCKFIGSSNKEINNHYRNNHQPLPCKYCSKTFNNPSSYRRHKYLHTKSTENLFTCYRCNKTFPFESQLTSHKDIHRRLSTFRCFSPGCTKFFRREATLVAHLKIHNGPTLQCDQCEYTCKDQRYLSQHYRCHTGEKKYSCGKCSEGFTFYQQLKRHRVSHESDEY